MRTATVTRKTAETAISATVTLDGTGRYDCKTGIGFFDHMLDQLARHSLIDLTVRAKGDLQYCKVCGRILFFDEGVKK